MNVRNVAAILAIALPACAAERPEPVLPAARPPAPPQAPGAATVAQSVMLRGIVRLQPTLTFRACDGQLLATAHDSTNERLVPAYQVIRPSVDEGMYVEVVASETATREVILHQLEYAARPGPGLGCEQRSREFLVRAFGRRPEWRLTLTTTGFELTQAGESPLAFPTVAPDDSSGHLRYRAGGLHLRLTTIPCTEDSTGTFASMQAVVTVAGKSLRGCASHGGVR